jgi:hypothetical protein
MDMPRAYDVWHKLALLREVPLDRARRCSELTLPHLTPPEGHNETDILYTPNQSLGAMGVNSLASKLLLSLFPPNTPFFRMRVSEEESVKLQRIATEMGDKGKSFIASIDESLARYERVVMDEIEKDAIRVPMFYALKLLVATGNACVYVGEEKLKVFSLDKYVAERDPSGNLRNLVIQERVDVNTLPYDVVPELINKDNCTPLFTYVTLQDDGSYLVKQELKDGTVIEGTEGTYTKDKLPFLVLRWSAIAGEHYGRGLVEEYLGDLNSLEALTKNILDYSAIASKVNFLVHPNGTTRPEDLARAENGEFVIGSVGDVDVFRVEKHGDMSIPYSKIQELSNSLSMAFLLNISVRRDAERVTATEVRYVASDLEDNLGGVYSLLAETLQKPLLNLLITKYTREGLLPSLPKGAIEPTLVTGIEALGRGNDYTKLKQFISDVVTIGGQPILNMQDLVSRLGTSLGIEMQGLVKTEEQIQQELEQQMEMQRQEQGAQFISKVVPELLKGGLKNETEGR